MTVIEKLVKVRIGSQKVKSKLKICSYSDPSAKNPESWLKKLYINPNEIK
jgi:hypothetical protein